ncbi:MAG TPA: hypothetical protein VNJ08_02475 [Bacteriovoracaceae bacterium]|nr:hypothetical protein [Bacteriovoracaceae bacterium]
MNEETAASPFIFYLSLEDRLPHTYFVFDRVLKDLGLILVPVKIDQLQTLAASTEQTHLIVITSTTNVKEYKLYNDKVRKVLKFLLKSKRLTFMHLSSFSKLNDIKKYTMTRNYFFLKYPLDSSLLAAKIARYHDLKTEQKTRWPGGKRSSPGAMAI